MTVTWHVDDLLSAHVDPLENTKLAVYLSHKDGDNITVKRGKVHDYLGMDLDFSTDVVAKVSMVKYIREIENDFPEKLGTPAALPAADHLFKIRDPKEAGLLDDDRKRLFITLLPSCYFCPAAQEATFKRLCLFSLQE